MKSITEAAVQVKRPEKIVQFGEGGFLRAFVDWMVDILNEKAGFDGNVVIVQPIERGLCAELAAQNCLYTTVLRGVQGGKTVEDTRLIRSVSRCVNPYADFAGFLALAENPDLRFVVSNTTEAGIAYGEGDKAGDKPPRSFPAKVTAFLYHRYRHFAGDPARAPVFIPCELIEKNGGKLRELVFRCAAEWGLGAEFAAWLEHCDFCSSLVDRVVSGYPRDEAGRLWEKTGYRDDFLDAAEIFHLWVIETKRDYSRELPFDRAGLNVIWTDDMSFYRTRKVRILNGAHTSGVLAGFLAGLDTVGDCIADPLVNSFFRKAIFDEIIPSMDGDKDALIDYAGDVLERFANPYIRHLLLSISLNSVSKFKTRVLPSIKGFLEKTGKPPKLLSFSLAALIAFYKGKNLANGELTGTRTGENACSYPIKDDKDVLKTFEAIYGGAADEIVPAVLRKAEWWGEDLSALPGLEAAVGGALASIREKGMRAAVAEVVR
jgi:tagaturonate reductase